MQIKYIPREGFPPRRPPQKQGNFPVGIRMIGQIVINDQYVLPLLHKVFRNGGCCIGRNVPHSRSIAAFSDDNGRIVQGIFFGQFRNDFRCGSAALPDSTVHAENALLLLV